MGKKSARATQQAKPGACKDTPLVRSVERVARIMETLFLAPDGRHLSDLSRELGLHKATALRLLRTLVAMKLVDKDASTEHYRWHPLLWLNVATRLPHIVARVETVQSLLEELAEATGETVGLAMPDISGRRMICVAMAPSKQPVRVHLALHQAGPMHTGATGKAFLASLPDCELRQWVEGGLEKITEKTIACPQAFLEEIARTRERGFATTEGESLPGASAVAVQVRDPAGAAVGALCVVAPSPRMTAENLSAWLPLLRRAAEEVSNRLYRPLDVEAGGGQ